MTISLKTHKMLWGRAASRCAFPGCRRELVMDASPTDDESLIHTIPKAQTTSLLCDGRTMTSSK
jgi:hypothetical protein